MNSDRKIAVLVNNMEGGGAQRVLLNLANGIANRGYSVDMVLAKAKGPYLKDISPKLRLVDLDARRALACTPALVHYLRMERPEVMLTGLSYINNIALLARRLAGSSTRVVITVHNTMSRNTSEKSKWYGQTALAMTKRLYPQADGIVAVSTGVADVLSEVVGLPRQSIRVIYNPVITPEMRSKALEAPNHPWLEAGGPPVFLGVGRLTGLKDFASLIQAFARVRAHQPARLMILGEGPERENLENLVTSLSVDDDVMLPGFVDNPYAYMAQSDVYVLSSQWEGLPTALIEALYCGTTVVSTDCPSGPSEILKDGQYGRLVPVGDVEAMTNAMTDALSDPANLPDQSGWLPFEQETAIDQYLDALLKE